MRSVGLTEVKPEWVLSATAHRTEWMITKIRLLAPSPNHSSASGSSAIAGSGLNIAVSVDKEIGADTGRDRNGGEHGREREPERIADREHLQRGERAVDQRAAHGRVPERLQRLGQAREQERIGGEARVGLPGGAEHDQHDEPPDQCDVGERSNGVSGRATSPTAPMVSSEITRSGRVGGNGRPRSAMSVMVNLRGQRGLDLVGEQEIVDAPLQRIEGRRAHDRQSRCGRR